MKLNLDDIAQLAGVSRTTVSRVINRRSEVSPSTRQKVWKVIEEHEFRPNPVAQMLVRQRTQIIGLAFCNPIPAFKSAYAPFLLEGINGVTNERDYATLMWWEQTGEEDRFSRRILQQKRLMDGMVTAFMTINASFIDHMVQLDIPFVMTDKPTRHADQISYVSIDNFQSAQMMTEHLIRLGRRQIAAILGPANNIDGVDRLAGYRRALQQNDIPFNPALVAEGAFHRQGGYAAMYELLARAVPIDAVFAFNDASAEGALLALQETGVRVPDDIALVGFDDVPGVQDLRPPLTTVRQPIQERGARATALLLDIIEGRVDGPQHILLPTQLVIRQSCGAAQPS
jgi:LacI family transcriptional regulator